MIKHVRRSFIKITMIMLTLMLIIPLCALNIITAALTYNNTKELLNQIAQTEIYILSPRNEPHEEPPPDEDHIGVGKQYHVTSITAPSVTTTADISSYTNKTTVTTIKTNTPYYNDNNNNMQTKDVIPNTSLQSTLPTSTSARPWGENHTDTNMPKSLPWGGNFTKPDDHEPNYAWTNIPKPDFEDSPNNYYNNDFDDNRYRIYGAAISSPQNLISARMIACDISEYSLEKYSSDFFENTTKTTTTTTIIPANIASDIHENDININTGIITKKKLNKNIREHKPPEINSSNTIDHFIVYIDNTGTITDVHGTDDYTVESCTELIENINNKSKHDGYYNSLQYVKKDYSVGTIVVFSDRQSDIDMMKTLFFVSTGVFILMEGIVFILTKLLTKRAMRPMQISYEKQQQFISDAGHELKTPLTVISANADILSDEIGENKWLSYIKSQTERMRILVQEMLDLTKITYSDQNIAACKFNISSLVENVALPFECQAFEQNKVFNIELEPDVEFFGNTERIRRMIGIFVDNAFKYSNENGTIKIQLKTENNKKVLTIYNTGIGIEHGEEDKIFERFYRSDSSRSTQGGYGLGLAIAKSIADQHNIKIQVHTEPGQWISFYLIL